MEFRHRTNYQEPAASSPADPTPDWIARMSPAELAAELEAAKAAYRTKPKRAPRHREADLVQAHAEILANRSRGNRVSHPIAEEMLANGGQPSLMAMARTWAANMNGPEAHNWSDHQVLAYASSSHLSEVMSVNANSIVMSRAPELQRIPIRLSRAVSLPDYKPMSVGTLTLDAAIPEPSLALDEWNSVTPTVTVGYLQAGMAPLRIRFSEILIQNDDTEAMARTVEATLLAASQNETAMFVRLLTTNGNLPDGQPWFSDFNTVLGSSASVTSLAAGMQKMREMTVNGLPADFRPRYCWSRRRMSSTRWKPCGRSP
jgi:hypothetical protein